MMRSLFPSRSELAFPRTPFSLVSRAYFFQTRDDERFETNTNARTHRSSDEREGEKNNYAPVYCSTSDFTHPLSPSSNVSKNAAPSNFCCSFPFAREREDPVVTNATVATVAIVFNPPILFNTSRVLRLIDKYVCVCVCVYLNGESHGKESKEKTTWPRQSNTKSLEKRELLFLKEKEKREKVVARVLGI